MRHTCPGGTAKTPPRPSVRPATGSCHSGSDSVWISGNKLAMIHEVGGLRAWRKREVNEAMISTVTDFPHLLMFIFHSYAHSAHLIYS